MPDIYRRTNAACHACEAKPVTASLTLPTTSTPATLVYSPHKQPNGATCSAAGIEQPRSGWPKWATKTADRWLAASKKRGSK